MAYAVENALYQWREGERRIANAPETVQADLDDATDVVVEELRRRLGSTFMVDELADLYGARHRLGARDRPPPRGAGTDSASVVDAGLRPLPARGQGLRGRGARARSTQKPE